MRRREFLAGLGALALSPASEVMAEAEIALRQKASAKGLVFGCAIGSRQLRQDGPFAVLVAKQAGILVHEGELKRDVIQPAPDTYRFSAADQCIAFAQENDQGVRGHTLVWHLANPAWLSSALENGDRSAREKLLTGYIETVMARYRGVIPAWDVVNEPIEPADRRWDGVRSSSIWYKALGEDYIGLAFHAARAADPGATLYLNDFGVEHDVGWMERRRTATLKLLDRLKAKNVPVDAYGIQGHLKMFQFRFSPDVFDRFLRDLQGYGLKLMITEYDMADNGGPSDIAKRDAEIAAVTRAFFDVALAQPAMKGILTWGLSDRYSWLSSSESYKRKDGQLVRGLPFDAELAEKPMGRAIAAAIDAAPAR